jgi:hypothetical protein
MERPRPMSNVRLVLLLAGVVLATATRARADEATVEPVVYFQVHAFKGPTYNLNVRGNEVLYQSLDVGWRPETLRWRVTTLPRERVEALLSRLESLGVFEWAEEYSCPAADGVGWSIYVRRNGRVLRSEGFNRFPPQFDDVQKAVSTLVGMPFSVPAEDAGCEPVWPPPEPTEGAIPPGKLRR